MFQLVGLQIGYAGRALCTPFSIEVPPGSFVSILGQNGAGKSTLLKTLSLDIPAVGGEVRIDGIDLELVSRRVLARTLAIVTTERIEADALTVREVVEMGRQPYTDFFGRLVCEDRRIVAEAMNFVGVDAMAERDISSLSDGERQKVMIARALAQETPVILLDEPTSFLDAASRIEVMALLKRLSVERRKTIILSTHDVGTALEYSSEMWLVFPDSEIVSVKPAALIEAYKKGDERPSPEGCSSVNGLLDRLFEGRGVQFSPSRLGFVASTD